MSDVVSMSKADFPPKYGEGFRLPWHSSGVFLAVEIALLAL